MLACLIRNLSDSLRVQHLPLIEEVKSKLPLLQSRHALPRIAISLLAKSRDLRLEQHSAVKLINLAKQEGQIISPRPLHDSPLSSYNNLQIRR